jgi:hypothetical protein
LSIVPIIWIDKLKYDNSLAGQALSDSFHSQQVWGEENGGAFIAIHAGYFHRGGVWLPAAVWMLRSPSAFRHRHDGGAAGCWLVTGLGAFPFAGG